eukprot:3805761-Amphidinium_carterae.1
MHGLEEDQARIMQFHFHAGCALHDCHNALHWGAKSVCIDMDETLKSMFVSIACMQKGVPHAVTHIGSWLQSHLEFRAEEELPTEPDLYGLYSGLGMDADRATQAADMSRWVTVGTSSRIAVLGVMTGYRSMVSFLLKERLATEWDLGGALKMEGQVLLAAVAIGLGSFVTEGIMSILLHDSRLLQQLPECLSAVQEEMDFLESIGPFVWETIGCITSVAPKSLRNKVLRCAGVARAYLDKKIFTALEQPPWCMLTKESVDALISNVMEEDALSDEPLIAQLQTLRKMGIQEKKIREAIWLMTAVSFTSQFTEKQHASAALVRRHHDLSVNSLISRAFVHVMRQKENKDKNK